MKKFRKKQAFQISIGDIFAVPLGNGQYGYIRAYHAPFFAIFKTISDGIIDIRQLDNVPIIEEASILPDEIEKGNGLLTMKTMPGRYRETACQYKEYPVCISDLQYSHSATPLNQAG